MYLKAVFFLLVFVLFYIYFGYPILLFLISVFKKNNIKMSEDYFPTVSLVIATYNEERVIEEKIKNSLNIDYPKNKLEIIIFSDSSTDRTDEVIKKYEKEGIKLIRIEGRKGKTSCQNEVVKLAKGEIIVFSDANSMYEPTAIKKIVRNFYDEKVGCVVGELKYGALNSTNIVKGENVYWNYDKILKKLESKICSVVTGNGAIYGLRKSIYVPLERNMISDFIEPLEIFKKGYRIVYEPEAAAWENTAENSQKEFGRRIRIVTRSACSLLRNNSLRELLNPFRYGIFSVQLLSHKVLRWFSGALMILIFLLNIFLLGKGTFYNFYNLTMLGQGIFYMFALWGFINEIWLKRKSAKIPHVVYYFCLSCLAMLYGVVNAFKGKEMVTWEKVR